MLLSALAGCGGSPPAPVEDRYGRAPSDRPKVTATSTVRSYQVQRGDTLYSIAFRYGLDFRKVASANNIPAPYTIYPGQKIRLQEAPLKAVSKPAARPAATRSASAGSSAPATASSSSATAAGRQTVSKAPPAKPQASSSSSSPSNSYAGGKVTAWRWPSAGRVTRGYSASVHKGIDISGKRGDPIVAVAAGKVVYAGTGIVGFGELLIVKHNDIYLSAYGHNDRLLVREGQVVKAGQRIAEKGSTGTDTVKLHFEIRREGKPVDPQRLLPRR